MLKDQLFKVAGLKHYRKLIEASDFAGEFNPAHQIDSDVDAILAKIVQEGILNILCAQCIVIHNPWSPLLVLFVSQLF